MREQFLNGTSAHTRLFSAIHWRKCFASQCGPRVCAPSLISFVLGTEDGGAGKELDEEEVRETATERRQRRMKEKLEKAKLRKKALFDSEYDATGNSADGKTFFDEWKSEMELQGKVCKFFSSLCCFLLIFS